MESPYLIAGLGNPGREYAQTRHNAGFIAVDRLAALWRADWQNDLKHKARIAKCARKEKRVFLCEPLTFMNSSGESIRSMMDFYKIETVRLLVLVDDADLPLGQIRLRANGSPGGHHGLESIEAQLGTRDYARLRIGIGRTDSGQREITGHVLGRFSSDELPVVEQVVERVLAQVDSWLTLGVQVAMNRFNGSVLEPKTSKDTK